MYVDCLWLLYYCFLSANVNTRQSEGQRECWAKEQGEIEKWTTSLLVYVCRRRHRRNLVYYTAQHSIHSFRECTLERRLKKKVERERERERKRENEAKNSSRTRKLRTRRFERSKRNSERERERERARLTTRYRVRERSEFEGEQVVSENTLNHSNLPPCFSVHFHVWVLCDSLFLFLLLSMCIVSVFSMCMCMCVTRCLVVSFLLSLVFSSSRHPGRPARLPQLLFIFLVPRDHTSVSSLAPFHISPLKSASLSPSSCLSSLWNVWTTDWHSH